MTNDNQDALRCAEYLDGLADEIDHTHFTDDVRGSAAHLRRLVAENEELRADVDHKDAFATQLGRDLMTAQREIEAKDALLRQAVEALDDLSTYESRPSSIWRYFYPSATGDYVNLREVKEKIDPAIAAIRLHLEGRA